MAMRRKKSAAMLPEPGPDAFAIRVRQFQGIQRSARKELKIPFPMIFRKRFEPGQYFEQEHQPVRGSLIAVFADDAGEVQITRSKGQRNFLVRFPAGAGVRRFAIVRVQFAAARTPQAAIRLLRPLDQQHFVALIEAVKQRGDFVGQRHAAN